MLGIFSSVKGLLKLKTLKIDNAVFQLHYKWTGAILLAFSILVTSTQYIGDPIDCVVDEIPQKVMDNYCWIYSTFTVPEQQDGRIGKDIVQPGVGGHVHGESETKHHQYYQWVCFTLVFQFILFQIPRYLWKMWEGGQLRALAFDLLDPKFDEEKKEERVGIIIRSFSHSTEEPSEKDFFDKVLIPFLCFLKGKEPGMDKKDIDYYTSYFRIYLRSRKSDSFKKPKTRNDYVKLFSEFLTELKKDPMCKLDDCDEERVKLLLMTSGYTKGKLTDIFNNSIKAPQDKITQFVTTDTLTYLKERLNECVENKFPTETKIDPYGGFNKESFKMDIRRRDKTRKTNAWIFYFCEILNLINVIGQLFFMDYFLGGEFLTYGTDVLLFTEMDPEKRYDPMAFVFPKVTKCTFNKFGPSGTVQRFDGLCVLPLNIINEKIYVFLWIWFVVLSVVTAIWVIYRSQYYISENSLSRDVLGREDVNLNLGDAFLLKQIKETIDPLIFDEIKEKIEKERKKRCGIKQEEYKKT